MKKTTKITIYSIAILLLFSAFAVILFFFINNNLFFFLENKPKIEDITVNSEPVFLNENDTGKNSNKVIKIYSTTLNCIYRTKIDIKKQIRKSRLFSLKQDKYINLHVFYKKK